MKYQCEVIKDLLPLYIDDVCSKESRKLILEIEDDLIPENAGIYEWEITPSGSMVTKILQEMIADKSSVTDLKESKLPQISMHIKDLAPKILTDVFINEIV